MNIKEMDNKNRIITLKQISKDLEKTDMHNHHILEDIIVEVEEMQQELDSKYKQIEELKEEIETHKISLVNHTKKIQLEFDNKDKQIEELKEENTELADKLYKERENVREITNIAGIALLRRPVEITNKTLYEKKFTVEIENNYFNDSKIYRSKEI